jgi:hypothetical protein
MGYHWLLEADPASDRERASCWLAIGKNGTARRTKWEGRPMGKGRCAGKRRDGRQCRNQPQAGSQFCWRHREEAEGGLDPGAELPATGDAGRVADEWVSPPRRLTRQAVRRLNWYWRFLHILRAMGLDEGVRLPILGEELPAGEPRLAVGDHELPAAAAAIFLGGTQLRVVGEAAYHAALGRVEARGPLSAPTAAEGALVWREERVPPCPFSQRHARRRLLNADRLT